MQRILVVIALLTIFVCASTATAIEKLYFADVGNDNILRCDLDGSNIEVLVTSDLSAVGSIAIDRIGGKMYWTDWPSATAHIKRAYFDGSDPEYVLIGLDGPWGLALDVPNGKMYWTEFSVNKIRRANLDGSNIEDLVTTGLSHLAGIALDLGGGKMYWADGATEFSAKIQRANMDGSGVETLIEDPLIAPQSIALDLAAGKMYFSDIGLDSLYRANLDGSGLEAILPSEYGTCPSVALDLDAGKIYFSDYGGSVAKIKQANLDGTGVTDIIPSGIGAVYGIALGPATADCSDASLEGPWLAIVTGVEPFDYAVYMIFDGMGTIDEMGAFNVPDSAGSYAVAPDCSLSGHMWSDGYEPFIGEILTDSSASVELEGMGLTVPLLKVMDVGALEGCWTGHFLEDSTGIWSNVTIDIDASGNISSSTGFPAPISGKIFTVSGYLAGFFTEFTPGPPVQYMFLEASSVGDSVMSGSYDKDCEEDCPGGTFFLQRCTATGVQDRTPVGASATISNYPNPFNPQTTITYSLPEAGRVNIRIYDAAGRFVRTVADETKIIGEHTATWDGRDYKGAEVSSGVYFVRFEVGGVVRTTKIVLLK
ncbi:MAG: T9SS type A sorting domain-containing protein [Candidatus Latescibacterota bacterium]|nr:MAG: T9SS type A sorting domain-containing protein [Candidatus Latescibacterota bacterium]